MPTATRNRETISQTYFSIGRFVEGGRLIRIRHLPTVIKENRTTDGEQNRAGAAVERQADRILGSTAETVKPVTFLFLRPTENA